MRQLKISFITILLIVGLNSCENGQFVGEWEMDSVLFDNTPYSIPTHLTMHSDYSFYGNGPFIHWVPQSNKGVYSFHADSIFFGPDTLQQFKVLEISSTNFTIQRYYYDSCSVNLTLWFVRP